MIKNSPTFQSQDVALGRFDSSQQEMATPNTSPISTGTDGTFQKTPDSRKENEREKLVREDRQGDAGHQSNASSLNAKLLTLLQTKGVLVKSSSKSSLSTTPTASAVDVSWWQTQIGSPLLQLLQSTNYSTSNVTTYMKFFSDFILPSMGPSPQVSTQDNQVLVPTFPSFMTDTNDPIEYGLTWANGKPSSRFSIEALSTRQEIKKDGGLNLRSTFRLCEKLEMNGIGSFDVFRKLAESVVGESESNFDSKSTIDVEDLKFSSQLFLAFDLPHGKAGVEQEPVPMVKGYLLPHVRASRTGESNLEVVEKGLEAVGIDVGKGSAWDEIRSYVTGVGFDGKPGLELKDRPELVILSNDCHSEDGARVKVYFRYPTSCFHSITEHLSLGGRIFSEWKEPLSKVWETLLGLNPTDSTPTSSTLQQHPYSANYQNVYSNSNTDNDHSQCCIELQEGSTKTGGTLIYYDFDLSPLSNRQPTSKVYLPVRHFKQSDSSLSDGIHSLLNSFGSEPLPNLGLSSSTSKLNSNPYAEALKLAFPKVDMNDKGLHTYVCIGRKKDGRIDVSTYLNPNLFPRPSAAQVDSKEDMEEKVSKDLGPIGVSNSLADHLTPVASYKRSSNSFLLHPYSFSRSKSSRPKTADSTWTSASSLFNNLPLHSDSTSGTNSSTSLGYFSRLSSNHSRSSVPSSFEISRPSFSEHLHSSSYFAQESNKNLNQSIPELHIPALHSVSPKNEKKKSKTLVDRANNTLNRVSHFVRRSRSNSVKK